MITDANDYFTKGCDRCARFNTPACSAMIWNAGLLDLRRICRDMGLAETVKWGHPAYMHGDRNIAMLGAFQGSYTISFFNPALLNDPEGVLEKAGPNAQNPSLIRFDDPATVAAMEPVIRVYLAELVGYADAGIKPQKVAAEFELQDELIAALDDDPELAEAFENLTPGRQRSYVINLHGAKQSATRTARIAKFRDKILAGKGALER